MLNSPNNTVRTVACLTATLWLSACANTGFTSSALTKSESGSSTASIYTGQRPAAPQLVDVVKQLEQQVANTPREVTAYLKLGVAYRHAEQFDDALQVFEQALALSESPHVARNEIGILQRTKGEFAKAEQTYLGILQIAPDFHDAHFNLGILYDLYMRKPLNAQKHYQAYIRNAPEADERVEKWLVDLERRHQIDASASAGVISE